MHQFQHACCGSGLAQLFDHPETHAAATMHRHARGFVDGQHMVVFHQNRKFPPWYRRRISVRGGHANWGNTHHIAGLDTGVSAGAALVDPHLAGADDAVDMGFGHALQVANQEVVQALTGRFLVHGQGLDSCRDRTYFSVYNVLHQCQVLSA